MDSFSGHADTSLLGNGKKHMFSRMTAVYFDSWGEGRGIEGLSEATV